MGCCCTFQEPQPEQNLDETQQKKLERVNTTQNLPQNQNTKMVLQEPIQKDGEKLKLLGNESFKNKNYAQAIKYYKQAIGTSKSEISYYSNLALAYKANLQYKQSVEIIDQMMSNQKFKQEKTSSLFAKGKIIKARSTMMIVKSYCLQGKFSQKSCHQHLLLINGAIQILEEIKNDTNTTFQNQQYLQTCFKLKQFLVNEVIPKSETQNILRYLTKKFANQRQYSFGQNDQHMVKYYKDKHEIIQQLASIVESLKATVLQQEKTYLIDPITYQYLSNAVIVPSGTTYNEKTLKEHFKNNGYNDPITHQIFQVGERVVVRNNNLHLLATQQKKLVSKDDLQFLKY